MYKFLRLNDFQFTENVKYSEIRNFRAGFSFTDERLVSEVSLFVLSMFTSVQVRDYCFDYQILRTCSDC